MRLLRLAGVGAAALSVLAAAGTAVADLIVGPSSGSHTQSNEATFVALQAKQAAEAAAQQSIAIMSGLAVGVVVLSAVAVFLLLRARRQQEGPGDSGGSWDGSGSSDSSGGAE